MRFQFWKREAGIRMLKNRFSFYNQTFELMKAFPNWLNWDELDFDNPEQFEKFQYAYNNLTFCFHNVHDVPATAVRKTFNSNICFHKFEILNCYPHESENFIKSRQCVHAKNDISPVVETFDDYYSDMMTWCSVFVSYFIEHYYYYHCYYLYYIHFTWFIYIKSSYIN